MIALAICAVVYLAIAAAVAGNLTVSEILKAEDFSLAEAARPAFGQAGVWFTAVLAVVATASGVMASVFAASRMLAMLTRMTQVPHRHFGMPGSVRTQKSLRIVTIGAVHQAIQELPGCHVGRGDLRRVHVQGHRGAGVPQAP